MTVNQTIAKTRSSLKRQGYRKHWIWNVNRTFKKFSSYCADVEQAEFSEEISNEFYRVTFGEMEEKNAHCEEAWSARRAIQMLKEVNDTGEVIKKNYAQLAELSPVYSSLLTDYAQDLKTRQHLATCTADTKVSVARDFMKFLENREIMDISTITIEEIELYLLDITTRQASASIYANMGRLKSFIKHLVDTSLLSSKIYLGWPNVKPPAKNMNWVEVFTPQELKLLLDSIDRANPGGKRLYAMLLLSLTTGMRGGEVCNIEFDDINWRESSLLIRHEKSGKKTMVKLQPAAGNAIVDYVANGRPKSEMPLIFLQVGQTCSSSKRMENANYSKQLLRQIELCGLKVDKHQSTGSHALRHAFASMLLENNTELPIISEVLGHSSTATTSGYTKIDVEHLRECALDITNILEKKEEEYEW